MKILIAVPTYETIYPDTFKSIYDLDRGGNEVVFEFVRGYDVATARNNIAMKAQEIKAAYVFMVDNDVVLPNDALTNLLSDGKDVVIGYYAHRGAGFSGKTCLCKLGERNYTMQYTDKELKQLRDGGQNVIQIHGGGMGCALIKTNVFKRMPYPYFDWVNYKDKGLLSEDLYFCSQCKRAKIPVFADTRVRCGHMFRYIQEVE